MKREPCPNCGEGRIRKRTGKAKGRLEHWYRECSKGCGYKELLIVQPAKIISRELYGTTVVAPLKN